MSPTSGFKEKSESPAGLSPDSVLEVSVGFCPCSARSVLSVLGVSLSEEGLEMGLSELAFVDLSGSSFAGFCSGSSCLGSVGGGCCAVPVGLVCAFSG